MTARPAIPQAVITWPDEGALPVGAGDPAAGIGGPAPFRAVDVRRRVGSAARMSLDAVMFSVLVVMLVGLAGAIVKSADHPNTAWAPRDPAALIALGASRAVVEVKGLVPAEDAASASSVVASGAASRASKSAAN